MAASSEPRLVFRADGNATIGLGHLVRLLALADMLRGLAAGVFLVRDPPAAVAQLLAAEGWAVQALPARRPLADEADWLARHFLRPTDVVVLDGYDFTAAYQRRLRAGGSSLVAVDDLRAGPVVADVLINHAPGVSRADYQAPAPTRFLLGPAFSLLRRPFLQGAAPPRPAAGLASAVVCFGGADPQRLTERTLAALLALPQLTRLGVVVGAAFGDAQALQRVAARQPAPEITIYRQVEAAPLAALLRDYAVAVVPASTVLIEALVLGRPAITGYYADNQRALATYAHARQQAFSVGNFADLAGDTLVAALRRGLHFHETSRRQPYVDHLRPDVLRTEIQRLLARSI